MALYDPNQSLSSNLVTAGFAPEQGTLSHGALSPEFLSAIQTAMARAGMAGYGGQQAFDLISRADPSRVRADPLGYANELLGQAGVQGFSSGQELASANTALPGHNERSTPFSPFEVIQGGLDAAKSYASNQGSLLPLAGAAGMAAFGPGAAPSAAAGGTGNAAIMGMGAPISAAEMSALGFDPLLAQLGGASAAASGLPSVHPAASTAAAAPAPTPAALSGTAAGVAGGGTAASAGLGSILSSPMALGIGAGALLGGLGGSQQAGTVTVEEGIPDWLQPYIKPQLDKYSTDLQNYQIDPYGVMPSAMKEFQNTISGMYLDPSTNKYLEDYFKLGAERVKGSLSPSFGHMQAFGQHSGYNEALSRGLGDFATGLYGGNYAKERDRQTQMTAAAPSFIGQSSQAAFQPYQQYLNTVGSLGKKKDQPFFENPFGNILGGAMVGGTLGSIWK